MDKYCFLCISTCIESFKFETEVCDQQLKQILEQHFWFQFDVPAVDQSEEICTDCFHRINDFHDFYINIRNIHSLKNQPNPPVIDLWETKVDSDLLRERNESLPDGVEELQAELLNDTNDSIPDECNLNGTNEVGQGKTSIRPEKIEKERSASENYRKKFEEKKEKLLTCFSFHCELCTVPLDSLNHAQNHYKSDHNCSGYLMCCNRRFFRYKTIFDHLEWHDNPHAFRCVTCMKTFQTSVFLRQHYNQAHNPKNQGPYQCDKCNKTYSRKNCFKVHLRSKHPVDGKRFECNQCQKLFALETLLNDHIRRSHITKYVCDICAKTFKSQKSYDLHYRVVHTKDFKRVQCDLCGAWLKHETALYEHVQRQHNKKYRRKIVSCEHCDKTLQGKSSLNRHILLVHSNISFPCPDCGKTFKSTKSLHEHLAIHMGIKDLYTCTFCPKTFRSLSNMLTHRKRGHPAEYVQLKMNGI